MLKALHIGAPRKGADIIVRLATDSQYQGVLGRYFNVGTRKPIVPIYPGGDSSMQYKLWKATKNVLKQRGYLE